MPVLGDMPIAKITTEDIADFLKPLWMRIPPTALTWIFNKAAPLNGGSRFFHTRPPPHDANRYTENTSIKTPANLDLS